MATTALAKTAAATRWRVPSASAIRTTPSGTATTNAHWWSTPRKRGRPAAGTCASRLPKTGLAVTVDDPAAREVVRRQLDLDLVARQDPDPEAAHLAGDVAEHLVPVLEPDPVLP